MASVSLLPRGKYIVYRATIGEKSVMCPLCWIPKGETQMRGFHEVDRLSWTNCAMLF